MGNQRGWISFKADFPANPKFHQIDYRHRTPVFVGDKRVAWKSGVWEGAAAHGRGYGQ